MTNHFGSYQGLGDGHRAIIEWVMANQKSIAGPPWEVYLSDPSSTPEEELVTRIFYPLVTN
jgi:effector-binding domain-containing protein